MLFASLRRCRCIASSSPIKLVAPIRAATGGIIEVGSGGAQPNIPSAPPSSVYSRTNRRPRRTPGPGRRRSLHSSSSSMPTTVRISSDLAPDSRSLRHGAALRIADHHLQISPFLPSVDEMAEKGMDAYCVGQAATCPSRPALLEELHDVPLSALSAGGAAVESHLWVSKSKVGSSAVTFGSAVTLNGKCLAACARTFVRIDSSSSAATPAAAQAQRRRRPRPIPVTEEEYSSIYRPHDGDADGSGRFGTAVPEVSRIEVTSAPLTPPTAAEGGGDASAAAAAEEEEAASSSLLHYGSEVLRVIVGPHHLNHGGHVDHAFLAEVGAHALFLGGVSIPETTLGVEYRAPGRLGQVLACRVSKKCGGVASIWGRDDDERRNGRGGDTRSVSSDKDDTEGGTWKIIALVEYR